MLATISFLALGVGSIALTLSNVILLDSALAEIPTSTVGASITVNPTTAPVPEPTSLLLLGTGLASLGYRRRRRTPLHTGL